MSLEEDIRPVTYLKNNAAALLSQVSETHRPVVITQNGEPKAVLQDTESYQQMRRALGVLKLLAQGEEDARAGRLTPHDEVLDDITAQLNARK